MAGDSAERVDESSIGAKFKKLWFYYIFQSFLAVISIFILVFLLGEERVVLISAMGATSFIVFAMPQEVSAKTRNVVGGHLVGIGSAALFYFFGLPLYISYPLAAGVSIFIMVALDVEHPPAVGTALAVVINGITPDVFVTVMLSALVLSQIRYYLRHHLKDLV